MIGLGQDDFRNARPHYRFTPRARPFPWFCPNCRRQEVRCGTIPYQCERFDKGQPVTVRLPALNVPKCGNCGELVFT